MPKIFNSKKFYDLGTTERIPNWLLDQIEKRLKGHLNLNMSIVGDTGAGKSYLALRLGELISKRFNTPFTIEQVLFDPTQFFKIIQVLPSRSVIMFDESSVSLDSHKWMTVQNKMLSYVTETYRFKEFVTVFCLPSLHMLDSRVRQVVHVLIRMYGKNCEEARVYRLTATHLGAQYLKGVGCIYNAKLPSYEKCKRASCRGCPQYKTCDLLRGQYERKKEESFNELVAFTQFRLSQLPFDKLITGSPYGAAQKIGMEKEDYGENIVDEDISDIDEK